MASQLDPADTHGQVTPLHCCTTTTLKRATAHFWAQGYFASTVGLDEEMIREYVRHQEESDDEGQSGLSPNK